MQKEIGGDEIALNKRQQKMKLIKVLASAQVMCEHCGAVYEMDRDEYIAHKHRPWTECPCCGAKDTFTVVDCNYQAAVGSVK